MKRPRFDNPAATEVRRLVRAQGRVVHRRVRAWRHHVHDHDALHDLRTSLRRLRVLLRGFRDDLHTMARRGVRRRLRQATRATSELRDLDVFVSWLRSLPESSATHSLLESAAADAAAMHADARERLSAKWRAGYRRMRKAHSARAPVDSRTLGTAAACLLRAELREIDAGLTTFDPKTAPDAVHRTRIAAKRVRYLLEALLPGSPDVVRIIRWCRTFQGLAGEWRDAALAAERLRRCPPVEGLAVVRRRHAARRRHAIAALRRLVADDVAWRVARRDGMAIARRFAAAGSSPRQP